MSQTESMEPDGVMAKEPHWIGKAIFAVLLGVIPWAVLGFLLNVLVPIAALAVCCMNRCTPCLTGRYYEFAYWFPLIVCGVTTSFLAWALILRTPRKRE